MIESVVKIVNKIQQSTESDKETYFANIYTAFKEQYPVLYKTACTEKIDMDQFMYLVDKAKQIEDNTISQHDASVEVGQKMYDRYINIKE